MQHYSALSECMTSSIATHTPIHNIHGMHACTYTHMHAHRYSYTYTHVIQCHKHTHNTDAYTSTCMHAFKTYDVHYRELEIILSMADVAYVQRSQVQSHARLNIITLTPSSRLHYYQVVQLDEECTSQSDAEWGLVRTTTREKPTIKDYVYDLGECFACSYHIHCFLCMCMHRWVWRRSGCLYH